jgi:nicotinamide mononucleotide transporter
LRSFRYHNMTDFFSINNTLVELWGYKMSVVEFLGTITGLIAVLLATQSNIWSWPVGILNFILSFLLFYQVSLYSDMFLQIYYFITGIYGWIYWYGKKEGEQTPITYLTSRGRIIHTVLVIVGTIGIGYFMSHIHQLFPVAFPKPAAYPYPDSFVAVMSILANWMLAQRRIENWILWIVVDAICTVMYSLKGIQFFSLEYFIFLLMGIYGLVNWIKIYNKTPITLQPEEVL